MLHGDISTGAFALLGDDHFRYWPFERLSAQEVELILPYADDAKTYRIPYDERERRPLIVLDGDIPENGLPRKGHQLLADRLGPLELDPSRTRQRRAFELGLERPRYLHRRFLILPAGKAVCIRYRNASLAYRYVLLTLKSETGSEWCLTSQSSAG